MKMQNDKEDEVLVEEPEPVKKKMGRPRIHPMKPPKEKKPSLYLGDRKAYFREYYTMHTKKILVCPTCNSEFSCKSSYTTHSRTNKSCMILRLQELLKNASEKESLKDN